MRFPLPTPSFRPIAVAVLVAAGLTLAPGSASASCGDYVTVVGQTDAGHETGAPRSPCTGPGCSNRPMTPILPLSTPVTSTAQAKELAARTAVEVETDPCAGWQLFTATKRPDSSCTSAIFHPPRAI